MRLEEFFDYKNRLMKLCCDGDVVRLVTNNAEADVPNHDLPYTQIFPFEFVPDTVTDGKTFICFDVDIISVTKAQNQLLYYPALYVWIFTHKSLLRRADGRLTLDALASEIDRKLNGSRYYGMGTLNLESVRRFVPTTDYLGRMLTYTARDFNRVYEQGKIPSNRKRGV